MNLTPTEQAEVVRFGVHDTEVLEWMELHADDVVPCGLCDAEAHWRVKVRCCVGRPWLKCHFHYLGWMRGVQDSEGRRVVCCFCGRVGLGGLDRFIVREL